MFIDQFVKSAGGAVRTDLIKATTKKEADGNHPSSNYLIVEDPTKPLTWHLRVKDADGKPDHHLMGGAWAALHGGYRGNKYEGPGKDQAIKDLKALYGKEGIPLPDEKAAEDEMGKAQARHESGKFSTKPENANTKEDHEAAARYHEGKPGVHHSQAVQAHRTAAQLRGDNSPVASIYSGVARDASVKANAEDAKQ